MNAKTLTALNRVFTGGQTLFTLLHHLDRSRPMALMELSLLEDAVRQSSKALEDLRKQIEKENAHV